MDGGFRENKRIARRIYSVRGFIRRVILTLASLVAISSVVLFLLVYLPMKAELEKSLMNNFEQLSFIRYASLQNDMDRGLEGARSLSSRSVIRNAILEYRNGEMDMDELMAATQLRYEDGAKALEYLMSLYSPFRPLYWGSEAKVPFEPSKIRMLVTAKKPLMFTDALALSAPSVFTG